MMPFNVQITDEKIRSDLLALKPFFYKQIFTNRKAKHCLEALEAIAQHKPFCHFLSVRLLGQLPAHNALYYNLLNHLNTQFKANGQVIVDLGDALSISLDDPMFINMAKMLGGKK